MSILKRVFFAPSLALSFALAVVASEPTQAQTYTKTTLFSFSGADGGNPNADLIMDQSGKLYVTTYYGGGTGCSGKGCGTVVELTPPAVTGGTWTERVLHSFQGGSDGAAPSAGLLEVGRKLYGTTVYGGGTGCGGNGCGTVFELAPHPGKGGAERKLYSFTGGADGAFPSGMLVVDAQGNLYGTTTDGGTVPCGFFTAGCGTLFKLSTNGAETVLHSFTGVPTDGAIPVAGLLWDTQGNLYGTTAWAGAQSRCGGVVGCGTVYKLDTTDKVTLLWSFGGPLIGGDGGNTSAALISDASGNLYGVAPTGGPSGCGASSGYGCGVVFEVFATGGEAVIYGFTGGADGSRPRGRLVLNNGILYGTTPNGGIGSCPPENPDYPFAAGGCGTVFKLSPPAAAGGTWTENVLYSFAGGSDGFLPEAGLLQDAQGNFYGTTHFGGGTGSECGGSGCGTVFMLTPH